ncbi:MAG: polysaccharide biosynthesis protein [Anaerolineae bacterium]
MRSELRGIANKFAVPILVDAGVVVSSLLLAWFGRSLTADLRAEALFWFSLWAVFVYCSVNAALGVYRRVWRYAAGSEIRLLAMSTGLSTALLLGINLAYFRQAERLLPFSTTFFAGFFVFFGFAAVRYQRRLWVGSTWRHWLVGSRKDAGRPRTLIVGAGQAGQLLAWRMLNQEEGAHFVPVGFVDDDPALRGMVVQGLPVLGDGESIPAVAARWQVELIIIADGSKDHAWLRRTLHLCEATAARVQVLPDAFDVIKRTTELPPLRDITAEDLLGRPSIEIDQAACRRLLEGKRVLVTGAAGSIGSELCRQVAAFNPQILIMLDNNETGLFDLGLDLDAYPGRAPTRAVIGDVTNAPKIEAVFAEHRPEVVFHAAAYKHVPLMEVHPEEAARVNVLGTYIVAEAACKHGAERLVFISTDKAVHPVNVLGASKRIGEMIVSAMSAHSNTLGTSVRFGNVLGSRGSVVPTFERQIQQGGPVTVTHPDMTRYFMSIEEAVSLVIQAASFTTGGDIFVLDMGEQVRIEELAERLIRLRGLRPGVDIAIRYTGIRSGEKLHEHLLEKPSDALPTLHPSIFRLECHGHNGDVDLRQWVDDVARRLARGEQQGIAERLWCMVRSGNGMDAAGKDRSQGELSAASMRRASSDG